MRTTDERSLDTLVRSLAKPVSSDVVQCYRQDATSLIKVAISFNIYLSVESSIENISIGVQFVSNSCAIDLIN